MTMTPKSRQQRYRNNNISLGKQEKIGQIQLTDRQLQLRESRRRSTTKHQSTGDYPSLGKEPTTTAPLTSSSFAETSSNVSSVASNPPSEFYGTGLYDDTGASWHESGSEASASTRASSNAEFKKKLSESSDSNKNPDPPASKHVSRDARDSERIYDKHSHQRRLLGTLSEEREQPSKEKPVEMPSHRQSNADPKPPSSKLNTSSSSDATSLSGADQQRAFLTKVLKSYSKGSSTTRRQSSLKRKSTDPRMEPIRQGSDNDTSTSSRSSKLSWAKRGAAAGRRTLSSAVKSASSNSSGSHSSHDKAILRKVLARARKNKPSSNPRKKDLIKASSFKMKNLISPRSTSSQESGSRFSFRRDNNKSRSHDEEDVSTRRDNNKSRSHDEEDISTRRDNKSRSHDEETESTASKRSTNKERAPRNGRTEDTKSLSRKGDENTHGSNKEKPHGKPSSPSTAPRESKIGEPKANTLGKDSADKISEAQSNSAPRESWQLLEPKRKFNKNDNESQVTSHSNLQSMVTEDEEYLASFDFGNRNPKVANEEETSPFSKVESSEIKSETHQQKEKHDDKTSSMHSQRSERDNDSSTKNESSDRSQSSKQSSVFSRQRKIPAPQKELRQAQASPAPEAWRVSLKKTPAASSSEKAIVSRTPTLHANNLSGSTGNPPSLVIDTSQDRESPGPPEGYDEFMKAAQREFRGYQSKAQTNKQEDVLNIIYSEDPEGYSEFLKALQAEASGSHSQLWRSFFSIFKGEREIPEPLHPTEKVKFDTKTKDIVANISNHLKRTSNAQCVVSTQLAKDNVVRSESTASGQRASNAVGSSSTQLINNYEAMKETTTFGQHLLQKSKNTISLDDTRAQGPYTVVADNEDSDKENDGTEVRHVTSSDSIDDDLKSNEFEVTLGQHARRSMGAPRQVVAAKHSEPDARSTTRDKRFPPTDKSVGSERGQPTVDDPAALWSNLKLRSVTTEKPAADSTPSWTKVKLRHVPKEIIKKKNTQNSSQSNPPSGVSVGKTTTHRPNETQQQPPQTIDLEQINTIETTASYGKFDDKIDEAVIIPLRKLPGADTDEAKMVIGSRVLMQIKSPAGESKALVIWRLDRNDVESITLDVSAFHVKLLLKNDEESKHLAFTRSEDCLKFANAFHEMAKPNEPESEQGDSIGPNDSMFVEQLSHEEQKVLEMFREKRKTKDSEDAMKESLKSPVSETGSGNRPFSVLDTGCGPPSPSSTISGSLLSTTESRIAGSYKKMLKENVPKDDVRHRMLEHNVDPKIMGFVLGEGSLMAEDASINSALSQEEEKVASVYRKMLKLMIPSDAVRHKMEKENVDQKIVIAVLGQGGETNEEVLNEAAIKLTGAEEDIANTYKKMLKMMVPKEAVEHKMKKENVDPKIIMVVVGGTGNVVGGTGKVESKRGKKGSKLSDEEESVASSYRQMLKLQIPRTAVRHRMEKEKIPENIIRSVLGEAALKDADSNKTPPRRNIKPGFHWNALPSGQKLTKSIWAKSKVCAGSPEQQEISKHIELFQKKQITSPTATQPKKSQNGGNDKPMAELMDLNRANNVSISLKAFKDFSNKELSNVIEFIDPLYKVHGDRVSFLRDILPAAPEVKAIMDYKGSDDALVPAERWFKQIVHVKRAEEKVGVLMTMETFKNEADELTESFQQLTDVCHQVMDSEKLPDLLEMVRQIGNRMNEGRGEAAGFKLDFLPRLAQTKGTDKKTTALDLMVMIFLARDQREALMLSSDFPECQNASRIVLSDLIGDVKALGSALKKCRQELKSLRKDSGQNKVSPTATKVISDSKSEPAIQSSTRLATSSSPTKARTDFAGPSQALFGGRSDFLAALKARSEQESSDSAAPAVADLLKSARHLRGEDNGGGLSPRASLKASMEKDGEMNDVSPNDDESRPSDYNLGSAMKRVQKFLIESDSIFPDLEAKRDEAIDACNKLSEFFCETGGEKAASTLLGILAEFAGNLDRAVKKHDEQQKIADRKQKAALKRKEKGATQNNKAIGEKKAVPPGEKSEKNAKKSLVLMVNEMLKVVGDKAKEQFVNGVDIENPDERLKTIYEMEKERTVVAKTDILSAIEQRRQLHGDQDAAQQGLSQLAQAIGSRGSEDDEEDSSLSEESEGNAARSRPTMSAFDKKLSESCSSELATILKKRAAPSKEELNGSDSPEGRQSSIKNETMSELASILQKRAVKSSKEEISSSIESEPLTSSEDSVTKLNGRVSTGSILASGPSQGNKRASVGVLPAEPTARTKQRYIDRWSSKEERDEDSVPEEQTIEKSDSDILPIESSDSEEARATQRKREQYMNRWARNDEVKEVSSADLDEDSDAEEVDERAHKTRQKYISRWSSQGMSTDMEEENLEEEKWLQNF